MKKIIEASMQRAVLLLVCIVLIVAWGGISAFQMQRDYLPSINNTTLLVSLRVPSYQTDQIKQTVTDKVTDAVRTADGLTHIETTSYDGGLLMSLYFPMDFDMKLAENEVKQSLANVDLPSDVKQTPTVTRVTTNSFPILSYSLSSDHMDGNALRSTVQASITKQLKSVPGVADVQAVGAANDGYVITVRMKDLQKNGLTVDDVNKSLTSAMPSWSSGKIPNGKVSIPIRIEGLNWSDQQIKDISLKNKQGKSVPLSAVADVSHSLTDVKTISRTNGKPSVLLNVLKTPSANITDVSERVQQRIAQIPAIQKGDVSLTLMLDRAHELNASLKGLVREGLLGCLFSMLCVFFFFRNVRSTLLIAVSLPISLLATTAVLKWLGITLNILTVSGLIVAMGRIVDDSIVILDNIYRRIQESKGASLLHTTASAVSEMLPAIFASTATTIAVYVPIAMVGGIVSASFSGFAWSVVTALVVSFFVAMLVIPSFFFMGWKGLHAESVTVESKMKPVLQFAFTNKRWVILTSIVLFVGAGIYSAFLPVNFLPSAKSGQVAVKVELPKGSSLSQVDTEVKKVESILRANPNVAAFSAAFGSSFAPQSDDVFDEGGGFIQQPNVANLSVALKDKNQLNSFIPSLQTSLSSLSNKAVYTVTNQNISGDDSQLKVMLTGPNQKSVDDAAQKVRTALADISGLSVDGKVDLTNGTPQYTVILNQNKIKQAGVKLDDITRVLSGYFTQPKDFSITTSSYSIPGDMYLEQLQEKGSEVTAKQNDPAKLMSLLAAETFTAKNGQKIRLDQLAVISEDHTPSSIQERDGQPYAAVTAQITSNDMSGVSSKVQQTLDHTSLPKGVSFSLGGISEQVKQMVIDMSIALAFSVLLVLLITSAVFKGWKAPLAVLLSIPMAVSGVVLSLILFGGEWNLAALVGVLMLIGIVVTNGIVMIDKIERNRLEGMEMRSAIIQGSLSRVRPIFMTAGTTILALLPLAFTHSTDTVISQTLGIVVIGGMITSTLNSFMVIPIIYEWLQSKSIKRKERSFIKVTDNKTC
ncbi:multidrug efflux pump subunit AcrB [Aneurinibacillus soli]|uniref:Swarming motility protein SwrC n=1 Tax=Aneurinibacillus soli TaxID=1500254 RepID=A0A0U5AXC1_9BACL|nr:efflux RND transporter permease subunit [Aneurinibacillus soli]PYE61757.1 multidrug efflux pump subunit AcrB [Aneurinibacillus soli]BAU28385.1 Swarming motility protein SwrC [Aneurinibacillus soli]